MSNLIEHTKAEFALLGWDKTEDKMQKLICKNILELVEVFAKQGHSGTTADYCLNILEKLLRFDPITPLTGENSEWNEISNDLFQNKRDSSVFKENGQAYWIEGKIYEDENERYFTPADSRVGIQFPWTKPKPEIVKFIEETNRS